MLLIKSKRFVYASDYAKQLLNPTFADVGKKIEEEIKQNEFRSPYQKVLVNILFTSSWLSAEQHQLLKPYKISIQQYNVLRILRGQHPEPASITLLTERMLDKNSNASRLVDKLRMKGHVKCTTSKSDKRQKDVVITQKGLDLLAQLDDRILEYEQRFQTLTEEEATTLSDLLDKLRQ